MKVLIVEDDKNLSKLIAKRLKEEGYDVVQAYDAEEGLNYANYEDFDIIILDLMLPKMSGFYIIESLRNKK
jgi:Response regulators consisting of a CheY-like receiver domain and a winged-helix DNA-binding domain